MPCSYCGSEKKIMARGLCGACYQRQWANGTLERTLMKNAGLLCSADGCGARAVAKGKCISHYTQALHPLTNTWRLLCLRHPNEIPDAWKGNMKVFTADVGDRPTRRHKLRRKVESQPFSAENVEWVCISTGKKDHLTPDQREAYERTWRLWRLFRLTLEEYKAMLDEQGGVCSICKNPDSQLNKKTGKRRWLGVDHCHGTQEVRGLLCVNCNRALGYFNDDIDRLRSAIAYLERHAAKKTRKRA